MRGPEHSLGPLTPLPSWRPLLVSDASVTSKFVLEPEHIETLLKENDMKIDELLQALVAPAAKLALPYLSGFFVGAVALGASGRVYMGGNMEFPGATLAASIHAEQCLTANLVRHREEAIVAVAISAPPCGHCRQFFSELCCAESMRIIFGEGPNNIYSLADILPHRFGPYDLLEDLSQPLLLQKQIHHLKWKSGALENLEADLEAGISQEAYQEAAAAALEAARGAYSPYTKCPSAIALISHAGIHCGAIIENAAHNPTLQPLQAAFISARIDGIKQYREVTAAVLVELEDAPLQQAAAAEALLKIVAPSATLHILHVQESIVM